VRRYEDPVAGEGIEAAMRREPGGWGFFSHDLFLTRFTLNAGPSAA
jgi:hypothetical protein